MNKLIVIGLMCLLLAGSVSAITVEYYYHPDCGHCKDIAPFMQQAINYYNNVNWNLLDTSKDNYNIEGTPFLKIKTDDEREIYLKGSYEIPRYLQCELEEQSNLNCPTYSAKSCFGSSWFIKE